MSARSRRTTNLTSARIAAASAVDGGIGIGIRAQNQQPPQAIKNNAAVAVRSSGGERGGKGPPPLVAGEVGGDKKVNSISFLFLRGSALPLFWGQIIEFPLSSALLLPAPLSGRNCRYLSKAGDEGGRSSSCLSLFPPLLSPELKGTRRGGKKKTFSSSFLCVALAHSDARKEWEEQRGEDGENDFFPTRRRVRVVRGSALYRDNGFPAKGGGGEN